MHLNVLYLIGSMMLLVDVMVQIPSVEFLIFSMSRTRVMSMDTMSWIAWHEEA